MKILRWFLHMSCCLTILGALFLVVHDGTGWPGTAGQVLALAQRSESMLTPGSPAVNLSWLQYAGLTASMPSGEDALGWSLAASGDTLVVGAPGYNGQQGAAYVFTRSQAGWSDATQAARLSASDGAEIDSFGYSVAIDGDTDPNRRAAHRGRGCLPDRPASGCGLYLRPSTRWLDRHARDGETHCLQRCAV